MEKMFNYLSEELSNTVRDIHCREELYEVIYKSMKIGKRYRCKDIPVEASHQQIGWALKHLRALGLVVRDEEKGEPFEVTGFFHDEKFIDNIMYRSVWLKKMTKTITPIVSYYTRIK